MKTERSFVSDLGRYYFDFHVCSTKNGFAQIDTEQDASYYGTWANPERLVIVNYAEGDLTVSTAETPEEFVAEIRNIKAWNEKNGFEFYGIDPGLKGNIAEQFKAIGLGDLLH